MEAQGSRDLLPRFVRCTPQLPAVMAELSYVAPSATPLYNYMYEPSDGSPQHNCDYQACAVPIADARGLFPQPSIHAAGFELWDAPSEVANFRDNDEVRDVYYKECAELARLVTGGNRCYVFDHQVRKREEGRPRLTFGRHGDGSKPAAAGRIHNDYTEASGQRRLSLVLEDAALAASVRHYCIVNIWRSIAGPILDTPLAVCDARSISVRDLHKSELRYPNRTGEIYLLSHSPQHQWFYYSRMDRNDVLVFKQYDSRVSGVARYTPHTAFDLPDIPLDAPLRESIEVRCLVVVD